MIYVLHFKCVCMFVSLSMCACLFVCLRNSVFRLSFCFSVSVCPLLHVYLSVWLSAVTRRICFSPFKINLLAIYLFVCNFTLKLRFYHKQTFRQGQNINDEIIITLSMQTPSFHNMINKKRFDFANTTIKSLVSMELLVNNY